MILKFSSQSDSDFDGEGGEGGWKEGVKLGKNGNSMSRRVGGFGN